MKPPIERLVDLVGDVTISRATLACEPSYLLTGYKVTWGQEKKEVKGASVEQALASALYEEEPLMDAKKR